MKRIFTPLVMMLLAFMFSLQSYAQKYAERQGDPVEAIEVGVDYLLADPWTADYHHLCGDKAVWKNAPIEAVYNFEDTGARDADGNILYRLKQKINGRYLEDPKLSNNVVRTTDQAARAFVFTALPGVPVKATVKVDGKDVTTEEWKAADDRTKYEPTDQSFENVFVFCNKDLNAETKVFEIFSGNYGAMWTQYTNARIWHIYKTVPATTYDNLCYYLTDNFPEEGVDGVFQAGSAPGQVSQALVDEFKAAYKKAKDLSETPGQSDAAYEEATEALHKAYTACQEGFKYVTPGFYVIDNNPASERTNLSKTKNACLTDIDGGLYWRGFDKPEVMTVEGAAFIWEVKAAEGENGGFYLRNYGTGRYAGGLSKNYDIVPSTEGPVQVFDINYRGGDFFSIDMRGQNATYPALHADANPGYKIVIWSSEGTPSQWRFIPVEKSELEGIEGELAQAALNKEARTLINNVKASWAKGLSYSSAASPDSLYDPENMGLVTAPEQYFSYTPESTEGLLSDNGLLDNNQQTIFHSCWSTGDYKGKVHNICADLTNEYAAIAIKYSRRNKGNDGVPTLIHVYTSNDTTGYAWVEQGYMNLSYPYASNETYTEAGVPNFTGISSIGFDKPYRFVRFDVEKTKTNGSASSGIYFNFSELRVYEAAYDKTASLIEAVPADVKKEVQDYLTKAQTELAAGKIAKETFEGLKAAYDKFMESFPDPEIINSLVKEAEGQANNAFVEEMEGQLGYFQAGAPEELKAAIEKVKAGIKPLMTMEEINAAKEKINAALAEFNKKLNVPADGMYCLIQCATSSTQDGSAADHFLGAMNNGVGQVKYIQPAAMYDRINLIWKVIKYEDGSYSFLNVGTNDFIGNPKKNDVRVNMSLNPDTLTLRSAKAAGLFNFVCTENVFYNAQPGTNNLVTWGTASGTDNSAFRITPIEDAEDLWDGNSIHIDFANKYGQIASYPYDLIGEAYGCKLYKSLGLNGGQLVLKEYGAEEVIPAGTPFVVIPTKTDEGEDPITAGNFSMPDVFDPEVGMTYVMKNGKQGGMEACLRGAENVRGGIFYEGNVISAVEGDNIAPNSGLFNEVPEATDVAEGADIIKVAFPANLETGIENMVIIPNNAGVYSISGVKVRNNGNLNNLPKGIYIVNGQKVLVK